MKNYVVYSLLCVFIFSKATDASEYRRFDNLAPISEEAGIKQNLVLCSQDHFLRLLSGELLEIYNLPTIKTELIKPECAFAGNDCNVGHVGTNASISVTDRGAGRVAKIRGSNHLDQILLATYPEKKTLSYIATTDIHECVCITIYSQKQQFAALMHIGFHAFKKNLLAVILDEMLKSVTNKEDLSEFEVTLTSSYYSPLLLNVVRMLKTCGFKLAAADIPPIYLTCDKDTSSGTKYIPVDQLGLNGESAKKVTDIEHLGKCFQVHPKLAELPRAVILDVSTGQVNRLVRRGASPGNSMALSFILGHLKQQLPYPESSQELITFADMLIGKLEAKRIKNLEQGQANIAELVVLNK